MTKNEKNILLLVPVLIIGVFISVSNLSFFSILGITLFFFFILKFFFELGKTIEIRDLIIVIALIQWIIGPILKYHYSPHDIFYYMAVSEKEYMGFVFPASLFFIIGLYFPVFYRKTDSQTQLNKIYFLLNN
ncbi:MAG: hypothetical protein L3J74_11375 [Bacteroidales bacterium]|nr:hypothetical protein [Bacteroidales bacterium]